MRSLGLPRVYIATAQAFDAEMAAKIAAHRADRQHDGWTTLEAPLDLVGAVGNLGPQSAALVDCATMWLSNQLLAEADINAETDALIAALVAAPGPLVVVSNEVGLGIVPENALARRFRVAQGALNCRLAATADCVLGVTAGLPRPLKGTLPETLA